MRVVLVSILLLTVTPQAGLSFDKSCPVGTSDLRSANGKIIGKIVSDRHLLVARMANGRKVGWFDCRSDKTYSATGALIGYGN